MLHKILYTKIYEIQFHTRNCIFSNTYTIQTNYTVSYGWGIGGGGGGLVVGGGGGGGLVGGGGDLVVGRSGAGPLGV